MTPAVTCEAPGVSVTFNPPSRTVPPGETTTFDETISVAAGTRAGTVRCVAQFLINDAPGGPEFEQRITVRVKDITPPTVTCTISPDSLWPPNHKMVDVTATVTVSDAESGPAGFKLLSVTSSEPDNGLGDGDTPNDIQGFAIGTPDTTGQLRAERSGAGTGRVYTLTYEGMDKAGNTATCEAAITVVPHDQGRR